jgi:hypothetical protein
VASDVTIEVQVALKPRTIADWVLSAILQDVGVNLEDDLACLTDSIFVPE